MKNYVTFETAQRLKEAGFPQPEPEFGQVWYEKNANAYVLGGIKDGELNGSYLYGQTFEACSLDAIKDDVFAPTAAYIFLNIGVAPFRYSENGDELMFLMLTNPERAASFWIGFNEKKQQ